MAKGGGSLFQYKDKDGVDVVVDRLEDVPQQYRGKMKILSLDDVSAEVKAPTKAEIAATPPVPTDLTAGAPFAIAGVGVGLVLGLVLGRAGKLGTMVVFLLAAVAAVTFYTSALRQNVSAGFSSPTSVVTDTQKAKALLENHTTTQQKALEEIERSEK